MSPLNKARGSLKLYVDQAKKSKDKLIKSVIFILTTLSFSVASSYMPHIAGLDFSPLPAEQPKKFGTVTTWQSDGCDNNPYYKNSIRFLCEGSRLEVNFRLNYIPKKAILIVHHLSSYSSSCPGDGYSPVTIEINGCILTSNFDPASYHNNEHGYVIDAWDVSEFLTKGSNKIVWVANELCTHYWLQKFVIVGE